jgi:hypothetical protein
MAWNYSMQQFSVSLRSCILKTKKSTCIKWHFLCLITVVGFDYSPVLHKMIEELLAPTEGSHHI